MIHDEGTIIACSSGGQVNAAIAVIRLSGFGSLADFSPLFSCDLSKVKPRQMKRAFLLERGKHVDDICFTYFMAPHSYTGENLLELYVHGNVLNIERVIGLFTSLGVRTAAAGEFSLRALRNKKLTLSQVEGLDLFLNASTPLSLSQGQSLLSGELQTTYLQLHDLLKQHKAALELLLDFHEDVGEEQAHDLLRSSLDYFRKSFERLSSRVQIDAEALLSPEIVIAGIPNAGKSSLFNILLKDDRAIVSEIAGTTRDYITERLTIGGVIYRLVDTAGVRESQDKIEAVGIERALEKVTKAFYKILLINPFDSLDGLQALSAHQYDYVCFTHSDRAGFFVAKEAVIKRFPQWEKSYDFNLLSESLVLSDQLRALVNKKYLDVASANPILLERHKYLILKASHQLDHYLSIFSIDGDVALMSAEITALGHCLSELIGIVSSDAVLDHVFSNFCIGK